MTFRGAPGTPSRAGRDWPVWRCRHRGARGRGGPGRSRARGLRINGRDLGAARRCALPRARAGLGRRWRAVFLVLSAFSLAADHGKGDPASRLRHLRLASAAARAPDESQVRGRAGRRGGGVEGWGRAGAGAAAGVLERRGHTRSEITRAPACGDGQRVESWQSDPRPGALTPALCCAVPSTRGQGSLPRTAESRTGVQLETECAGKGQGPRGAGALRVRCGVVRMVAKALSRRGPCPETGDQCMLLGAAAEMLPGARERMGRPGKAPGLGFWEGQVLRGLVRADH